jgi:hypothetical protein
MMTMTRSGECTAPNSCLLIAFEMGQRLRELGFTVGGWDSARVFDASLRAPSGRDERDRRGEGPVRIVGDVPVSLWPAQRTVGRAGSPSSATTASRIASRNARPQRRSGST